ncbi:dihydrofolate reductase family protein [Tardiphaga sp. 866_E4_N2_1]|uniref:dihydrofolate reductase family protein n=1 Tax=unclassified Tardiphaga TaxID=2631404 RepID=UPI003F1F4476
MKPHVICHMGTSLDGRTIPSRWRPTDAQIGDLYDRLHTEIDCDAWVVGRVTGQEFAKRKGGYPSTTSDSYPREPWIATRDVDAYAVVLDERGRITWGRSDIGGDHIVVVLCEAVPDAHLAGLRSEGISYVFAGNEKLDLSTALEVLNSELGVERLLLEGGGNINGAFLRAGLIDEISLILVPAIDGASGVPALFDGPDALEETPTPIRSIMLQSCTLKEGGNVWLRYAVKSE